MKVCTKCGIEQEFTAFKKRPKHLDGHANECKSCSNLARRTFMTPEKNRAYHFKYKYKLTIEDFNSMYVSQKGKCKICDVEISSDITERSENVCNVDHDHITGEVRGLLCTHCNVLLGMAKDNVNILATAIKYLNKE